MIDGGSSGFRDFPLQESHPGAVRSIIQSTSTMAVTDGPCARRVASSHPPRVATAGVAPECLLLLVLFFDLGWHHGLRERQRQRVPIIRPRLAAPLNVGLRFQRRAVRRQVHSKPPAP